MSIPLVALDRDCAGRVCVGVCGWLPGCPEDPSGLKDLVPRLPGVLPASHVPLSGLLGASPAETSCGLAAPPPSNTEGPSSSRAAGGRTAEAPLCLPCSPAPVSSPRCCSQGQCPVHLLHETPSLFAFPGPQPPQQCSILFYALGSNSAFGNCFLII